MEKKYEEELLQLTPREREIVLRGLKGKLGLYKKKGILSYQYEVCPICQDVGSTEANPKCEECYLKLSCKAPFNDGFRDDPEKGAAYFSEMRDFLEAHPPPRTLVVGGTWDEKGGKKSSIVSKLAEELEGEVDNGGTLEQLKIAASYERLWTNDLIIWMPNILGDVPKCYPRKPRGAVLVCSKAMREGYKKSDAVTRIFMMRANSVIQIRKPDRFEFILTDALGNDWVSTGDLVELVKGILKHYWWTKGSERVGSERVDAPTEELERLMVCTRTVADRVENQVGSRYFGNVATRCQKMFPVMRPEGFLVLVSPRNSDKRRLEAGDMVPVMAPMQYGPEGKSVIRYFGAKKPSVDTPIQLQLFEPGPHFFIHGHALVKGAPMTERYFPCGDLREVDETAALIQKTLPCGAINLRNHGFLLHSRTIEQMERLVRELEFGPPNPLG
jgi:hypothetical protein